jgi:hypothetical protein
LRRYETAIVRERGCYASDITESGSRGFGGS